MVKLASEIGITRTIEISDTEAKRLQRLERAAARYETLVEELWLRAPGRPAVYGLAQAIFAQENEED